MLPRAVRTLAEDFHQAGYRTAAFVSGFPLKRRFGFDRGFDSYDDHLPRGKDARRTAYVERTADRTTDAALAWLRSSERGDAPFFLWVHYFDPHAPYEAPAEAMVGAALALRRRDRLRRTAARAPAPPLDERRAAAPPLVLVTADHGESLGEHGEDTHGIFVYDATLRVPLLLAGPGVPAGVVASTVARGDRRGAHVARLRRPCASDDARTLAARAPWPASGSPTSRPTPNRSIRSSSTAGRRCTRGGPRSTS